MKLAKTRKEKEKNAYYFLQNSNIQKYSLQKLYSTCLQKYSAAEFLVLQIMSVRVHKHNQC